MKTVRLLGLAASALVAFGSAGPANALVINLIDNGGVARGTQAFDGFSAAARYWESVITSDVTVNFRVGFSPLASGVLGQAGSSSVVLSNALVQNAIRNSAVSTLDQIAAANLPNNLASNPTFRLNTTVARALGFTTTAASDATITFNSDSLFDFDTRDGFTGLSSDFISVAVHEMGHALGFTSGSSTNAASIASNMDMFRYTAPGTWSKQYGVEAYFSIDGGQTELFGNANFSTGADGRQTSHWKDGARVFDPNACTVLLEPQIGIMDPTGGICQLGVVTAQDLGAFDALGWTLNLDILNTPGYTYDTRQIAQDYYGALAAVPEPSGWIMLIGGFALTGAAMRRRSTRVAFA